MKDASEVKKEYYRKYREENKEKLNEYKRQWRAENPEKTREYNQRYWERKAACIGV
ncbi:MAG: hypothetical protein JJT76_06935 [Clostridiaceae bacterium]|nr:hypothetical protein [Clostridiaceae bacterium]